MATKTEFAGLTALAPGEPLSVEGYAFQAVNPLIVDRLLKLGARTHRHDGHPGINGPVDPPVVTLTPNGSLPASADIAVTYTLVDADGGETRGAPAALITTNPPLDVPDGQPLYDIAAAGGHMLAGTYTYALTLTDGNGETPAGPPFFVNIDPGTDTNLVSIQGLSDIVAAVPGATGWRLYKASSVGQLHFLAAGGAGLDDVEDDGLLCADCAVTPPTANTTAVAQGIEVTIPNTVGNQQTGIVAYRVYATIGGVFVSPSYVEQRIDFGVPIDYTHIVVNPGMPPDVSTSYGGAQKIDPDTELLDWHWKSPVATAAELPGVAVAGDVRIVLADGTFWTFGNDNTWHPFTAPVAYWKPPVNDATLLPPASDPANAVGDVRLVLPSRTLWGLTEGGWTALTAPQHEIWSELAPMPQRSRLRFLNCNVSDDEGGDQTIIEAQGGGGGGAVDLKLAISEAEAVEWVDEAGITQLKLVGQSTDSEVEWFTDGFDVDPLAGWGMAGGQVGVSDPVGDMVPLPTHELNADRTFWKGGSAERDMVVTADGLRFTALNFTGVGIVVVYGAFGDYGWRLRLQKYDNAGEDGFRGQLQYRVQASDVWTSVKEYDVDPAFVGLEEGMTMRFTRRGNKISVAMWNYDQGNDLFAEEDIDVPVPMLAFVGAPGWYSNITDPVSWKLDNFSANYLYTYYQLLATATAGSQMTLADTAPSQYEWVGNPGDASPGWQPNLSVRKTPDGGLEFKGSLTKTSEGAPLAGEIMFTFDMERVNLPVQTSVPVVTGDNDDVRMLGIMQVSKDWANTLVWDSGRSTDPATKNPYVLLDGLKIV